MNHFSHFFLNFERFQHFFYKKNPHVFDFLTSSMAKLKGDLAPMLFTSCLELSVLFYCQKFSLCAAFLTSTTVILTLFACRLVVLCVDTDFGYIFA
jgi:hypothetical protein